MDYLVINSVTSNSIGAYISGLDTNYSRSDRYIDWYLAGSYNQTTSLPAYASQSSIVTFLGLSSNTYYTITGRIFYTLVAGGSYSSVDVSGGTTTSAGRPAFFYWTYPKTSGQIVNLYAFEWNDFMNNINLVRTYKGLFTVSYTTAYSGNTITAAMYNQAYSAVSGMYFNMTTQGQAYINAISAVNPGDILTANHLNYLQLALNTVT